MRGIRVGLVVAIVIAILAYVSILVSGGGLGRRDGFTGVGPNDPVFTLFYMKDCPHCDAILPKFDDWAAAGQFIANGKPVKIRKLERAEAGPLLDSALSGEGISGFPTFVLTTAGGKDIEYKGSRDVNGYKEFITANVS